MKFTSLQFTDFYRYSCFLVKTFKLHLKGWEEFCYLSMFLCVFYRSCTLQWHTRKYNTLLLKQIWGIHQLGSDTISLPLNSAMIEHIQDYKERIEITLPSRQRWKKSFRVYRYHLTVLEVPFICQNSLHYVMREERSRCVISKVWRCSCTCNNGDLA